VYKNVHQLSPDSQENSSAVELARHVMLKKLPYRCLITKKLTGNHSNLAIQFVNKQVLNATQLIFLCRIQDDRIL